MSSFADNEGKPLEGVSGEAAASEPSSGSVGGAPAVPVAAHAPVVDVDVTVKATKTKGGGAAETKAGNKKKKKRVNSAEREAATAVEREAAAAAEELPLPSQLLERSLWGSRGTIYKQRVSKQRQLQATALETEYLEGNTNPNNSGRSSALVIHGQSEEDLNRRWNYRVDMDMERIRRELREGRVSGGEGGNVNRGGGGGSSTGNINRQQDQQQAEEERNLKELFGYTQNNDGSQSNNLNMPGGDAGGTVGASQVGAAVRGSTSSAADRLRVMNSQTSSSRSRALQAQHTLNLMNALRLDPTMAFALASGGSSNSSNSNSNNNSSSSNNNNNRVSPANPAADMPSFETLYPGYIPRAANAEATDALDRAVDILNARKRSFHVPRSGGAGIAAGGSGGTAAGGAAGHAAIGGGERSDGGVDNDKVQRALQMQEEEKKNRLCMLRMYGEENSLFYERLVQLVGQDEADQMVREAVDETIKEEVGLSPGGGGGREVVDSKHDHDGGGGGDEGEVICIDVDDGAKLLESVVEREKPKSKKRKHASPGAGKKKMGNASKRSGVRKAKSPQEMETDALPAAAPLPLEPGTMHDLGKKKAGRVPLPPDTARGYNFPAQPPNSFNQEYLLRLLQTTPSAASAGGFNPSENATARGFNPSENATRGLTGAASAAVGATATTLAEEEPPGFDQFKADPKLCGLLFESANSLGAANSKAKVSDDAGMFTNGLLNITDNELLSSIDMTDPAVHTYIKDVILPCLNIDPSVTRKGHWETYTHITSRDVHEFARMVVYQRRKSMKSAVELALYEIGKCREDPVGNNSSGKKMKGATKTGDSESEKDKRIKELEKELNSQRSKHADEMTALRSKHAMAMNEAEELYTKYVSKLVKRNKRALKKKDSEMNEMKKVHTTFLESYVESSLDTLHELVNKSPPCEGDGEQKSKQ